MLDRDATRNEINFASDLLLGARALNNFSRHTLSSEEETRFKNRVASRANEAREAVSKQRALFQAQLSHLSASTLPLTSSSHTAMLLRMSGENAYLRCRNLGTHGRVQRGLSLQSLRVPRGRCLRAVQSARLHRSIELLQLLR